MIYIQSKEAVKQVDDLSIANAIREHIHRFETQFQEPYQATQHGWFVVFESLEDLTANFPSLDFSLSQKLNACEVEYVQRTGEWFEVCIVLNDTEAILIYVPQQILNSHQVCQMR